jgi:hypothetical protein
MIKSVISLNDEDSSIVSNIENKYTWFLEATRETRRQWLVNSAFTRGQHFSVLHRDEDRLVTLQENGIRKMVMDDMISPWKQHFIANMVMTMPVFEGVPENYDGDSVSSARLAGAILTHYWETWKFSVQYISLCNYLVDFGNAYIVLNDTVDETKFVSRELIDVTTGMPVMSDDGTIETIRSPKLDIEASIIRPDNLATHLDATSLEEKQWIAIVQRRPIDYFTDNYNKKIMPEDIFSKDGFSVERISDTAWQKDSTDTMEYANEIIYMQKPCKSEPNGMVASIAGGVMLEKKEWPYDRLDTYPIEHFHYPKESGEFLARSPLEKQISLQKLLNLTWSIYAENLESMSSLKMLVPYESGVAEGDIIDMPQIIRYAGNFEPHYMAMAPLPEYTFRIDAIKNAIRDMQNYHGASLGTSVSGVRSDLHAQNLQEQDQLPMTVVDELMRAGFERLGEKLLVMVAEKITDERIISYTGKNNRLVVQKFKGAMLGDTKKVKVRLSGLWKRNKSAVVNTLLQMYQYGMIQDQFGQPDAMHAYRMMEFALPDSAHHKLQVHTDLAYHENDQMAQGLNPPVLPWQIHRLHNEVHQEFMNSIDFMKLFEDQEANGIIIKAFADHIQLHNQFVQQAYASILQGSTEKQGSKSGQQAPAKKAE